MRIFKYLILNSLLLALHIGKILFNARVRVLVISLFETLHSSCSSFLPVLGGVCFSFLERLLRTRVGHRGIRFVVSGRKSFTISKAVIGNRYMACCKVLKDPSQDTSCV